MIFGTLNSKFISGSTTVDLPSSVIDPGFIVPEFLSHQSIITGKVNYIPLGYFSEFKVQLNLFKYASPSVSFNQIESYKNTLVTFYPHKDGTPIKDIYGNEVQFLIYQVDGYYLINDYKQDIINITFKADRYSYLIPLTTLGYGYGYGEQYGLQL